MSLPVIDMAPLFTGDAGAQSAVAAAIARACEDDGFFYVIDRTNGKLLSAEKYATKVTWASKIDLKTGTITISIR